MTDNNSQQPVQQPIVLKNLRKPFGWKHIAIRTLVVLLLTLAMSYLESSGTINATSGEAKLMVPAAVGLLTAIMNWRFLIKISLIIMPIWFAAALAIFFAGMALVSLLKFEPTSFPWLAVVIQYLPPAIAGHWLYSGYSRMSRSTSIPVYFMVVVFSVITAILVYADFDIYILQTGFLTFICFALNLLHWNHLSVGVKADKT